ncbi:hypothetical protein F1B92_08480, partial [Campylobacter sp. FMV-PI01]|nr:hypothetical protein [Campylobacter portucalensis]
MVLYFFYDNPPYPFSDNKATIPDDYFSPNIFPQLYDPLTLDLNGDSKISTLNLSDGVYFDHNGDKIAFKTSWISKDDGILVFDKNNNGLIDNGNELFGNFTEISNSQTLNIPNNQTSNLNSQTKFAINGYHALSLQDSNNDGRIDSLDEIFSNLKIWQDLNEDGISQSNELKTLDEHGIKSISLNFTKPTNGDILKDSSDNANLNDKINNLNFNNINSNNSNINNNPNSTISNNNLNLNSNSTNDNKATLISH